ncbi:alpha-(1-_3)-arabinofuranosyltransferase [soil metagenome]
MPAATPPVTASESAAREPRAAGPAMSAGPVTVLLYVFFVAVSLLQQPGLTTYDTRAELTQRPLGFLGEAFTLWHPESNFGEFQNQAYGYLFPQGAWFALADVLHAPDWVAQRLWSALVLIVACEGARRVARVVGFAPTTALGAGLVFAFSPRLLGTVSVITGESLPGAVMPWVLLPVLLALRGRSGWARAAVLSGAAVVCMGGVNAVEDIGSLPLVAIVVVWGVRRGLAPRRFLAQWSGAVLLAATWWLLPLLVLAGYAPPFYEYVESAANTTALIGWSEATRGDSHWVAYLITGDRSWWPAAHALVSVPWLIVVSAVVSAVGLWGLARFEHPLRRPLLLGAVVGLTALTIAHGGWEGSPVGGPVRGLLDGPLQIFRNVHKIDPVVRLPLALGFANAIAVMVRAVVTRRPAWVDGTAPLVAAPLLLVLALGQPYLVNTSRTPGWDEISTPWQQAQAYLAEHEDGRTTLVLPGSGFAQETWGWTLDEPLQVLGGVNRASRSQVPIIPGQSIRYLAALDQLASTGRAGGDLSAQLARAGIGHVVIRRDLLRDLTGSPYPGGAAVSVANGGLRPVAQYGDNREGGAEVEVLEVPERLPTLRATPVDDVRTVRGAPDSVLALQDTGVVAPEDATVLEGEPGWDTVAAAGDDGGDNGGDNGGDGDGGTADVVTDGDQRRERAFGVSDESVSAVLGPDDPWRTDRAVHDFPTVDGARQVLARYDGLSSLTASSAQGYADNFGPVVPQAAPYAAVDGDPQTRWVTSVAGDPDAQWLRLDFDAPRQVHQVRILPVVDDPTIVPPRTFEVRAGDEVRTVAANPSGAASTAFFDGADADFVEVRITRAATRASQARVGLREVQFYDLRPTRTLVVPGDVDPGAAWVFATSPERRACAITLGTPDCDAARIRGSEEPAGMDRTFTTTGVGSYTVRGSVVARTTREASRLLDPVVPRVTGTNSIYGNDPQVADRFAYDGQATTSWVSADEDQSPTLFFDFAHRRTLRGISVTPGAVDATPVSAVIRSETTIRQVSLRDGGVADFKPLRGTRFEVTFVKAPGQSHVAIAELRLRGVRLARAYDPAQVTGAVCGLGPNVEVDGERLPTRVTGTLADVANGSPLSFESCVPDGTETGSGAPGELTLAAGEHRLTTPPTREFQVNEVAGVPVT